VGEIDSLWKGKVFATDRPLNGAGYLVSVQVFSSQTESNRKYRVSVFVKVKKAKISNKSNRFILISSFILVVKFSVSSRVQSIPFLLMPLLLVGLSICFFYYEPMNQ
jgi:hypothetical protein